MASNSTGPVAQQLAKIQSNGQQPAAAIQPPPTTQPPQTKKNTRTGFADKTLWDWLQLLGVIAIPIVVTLLPLIYSIEQSELQLDQQRDVTLKTYMDDMENLLLHEGLYNSRPDDEVRVIARVKTLTALFLLDSGRKRALLRFVYQAGLIGGVKDPRNTRSPYPPAIISLEGANLSEADLKDADLRAAQLNGANLETADLRKANLEGANLSGADLKDADLEGADLRGAKVKPEQLALAYSLKGAILPDGSMYPSQRYPVPNHTEPVISGLPAL